jgi:hypothetical protein
MWARTGRRTAAERVVLGVPSETSDKVLPILDGYTKLMR